MRTIQVDRLPEGMRKRRETIGEEESGAESAEARAPKEAKSQEAPGKANEHGYRPADDYHFSGVVAVQTIFEEDGA